MASKKCKGLYLIGEMLDCEGRIGGFNFPVGLVNGLSGRPRRRRVGIVKRSNFTYYLEHLP